MGDRENEMGKADLKTVLKGSVENRKTDIQKKVPNDQRLAYWLQGFFEISGSDALSDEQIKKVVKAAQDAPASDMSKLILSTVLDNLDNHEAIGPLLAKKLAVKFKHDIDPSYEGDQSNFNNIHGGGKPPGPDNLLRC
jgi:hypothetical protein